MDLLPLARRLGVSPLLPTPPRSPALELTLLLVTKHGSDSSYLMFVVPPLSPLSSDPRPENSRGIPSFLGFRFVFCCQTPEKELKSLPAAACSSVFFCGPPSLRVVIDQHHPSDSDHDDSSSLLDDPYIVIPSR